MSRSRSRRKGGIMQRELDSFDQGSGGSPVLAAEGTGWLDPATGDVLLAVAGELAGMASLLGRASARRRIGEIQALSRGLLHRIAQLVSSSQINPWTRIRLSPTDPPLHPSANAVRLGVFPTTANPLHWGHLLSALAVMAELGLDRVAFIIARDPASNGDLFPEEIRRGAAVEALQHFQPFFTLAPASAGRTASGPRRFRESWRSIPAR